MVSIASGDVFLEVAWGLKTWTPKNACSKRPPQKPSAATSYLAPPSLIAEAPERASPVIDCSGGSMHTSWHTSDIKFAVKTHFIVLQCRDSTLGGGGGGGGGG